MQVKISLPTESREAGAGFLPDAPSLQAVTPQLRKWLSWHSGRLQTLLQHFKTHFKPRQKNEHPEAARENFICIFMH